MDHRCWVFTYLSDQSISFHSTGNEQLKIIDLDFP
jgi:hypothetical protein